jgi:replicative DNA helicase
MSVASLPPYEDDPREFGAPDRTPPQDVQAEQSVLGAMLLSKDAIGDVAEVCRGRDFYRDLALSTPDDHPYPLP